MNDVNVFADPLIEGAYRLVLRSMCNTENEKALFATICRSCDKNGISVQKYLAVCNEVTTKMKELEECE
jgi:hypothetical protein